MSSYWGATYGVGLILNTKEYEDFIKQYEQICVPLLNETETNEFESIKTDDIPIDEIAFVKSETALEHKCTNKTIPNASDRATIRATRFYMSHYTKDESEGLFYLPLNTWDETTPELMGRLWEDDDAYIVWFNGPISLHHMISHETCVTESELTTNFYDSLVAYLPKNFDYEAHIAELSYCTFA